MLLKLIPMLKLLKNVAAQVTAIFFNNGGVIWEHKDHVAVDLVIDMAAVVSSNSIHSC